MVRMILCIPCHHAEIFCMNSKELRVKFDETATEDVSIKAELKPGSESYANFFQSDDICRRKSQGFKGSAG